MPTIDVVIPAYNESDALLAQTIESCEGQTLRPRQIFVVDDGSTPPLSPPTSTSIPTQLIRNPQNRGVSYARNRGAERSDADFLLFLDTELVLPSTWCEELVAYLEDHPTVGLAAGPVAPQNPSLLTHWRLSTTPNPEELRDFGEIRFSGHSMMVRRTAYEACGGYDEQLTRTHEDFQFCEDLRGVGFSSHLVDIPPAVYLQEDTLDLLARKLLRHSCWSLGPVPPEDKILRKTSRWSTSLQQSQSLLLNTARHVKRGRFSILPVDVAVWAKALQLVWTADQ